MTTVARRAFGAIKRLLALKSLLRGATICTVFAIVLSAGTTADGQFGLFQWRVLANDSGSTKKSAPLSPPTGAASLDKDDPVNDFAKTGVGQVLFTSPDTDKCQRTLFDNRTGASHDVAEINCGQPFEIQKERLEAVSKQLKK